MKIKKLVLAIMIFAFAGVLGGFCAITAEATYASAYKIEEEVYLGGTPLGILISTEGVYVGDYVEVITERGCVCPAKNAGLQKGDMIIGLGGNLVKTPQDIIAFMKGITEEKKISLQFKRHDETVDTEIVPAHDITVKQYKLGFMTKSDLAGIGTLTYIKKSSYRFGSLGHRIYDATDADVAYKEGTIYSAGINGIKKGTPNEVGGLKGSFDKSSPIIGRIDKNTAYGVFGFAGKEFSQGFSLIPVGTKNEIQVGDASIYTTLSGSQKECYSIEIVRTIRQTQPSEKGMVIRVTDKRLLDSTGGIVQGMSGSPIVQNGKLIGAVSHVFTNDPTMGYGMYIDWMLQN